MSHGAVGLYPQLILNSTFVLDGISSLACTIKLPWYVVFSPIPKKVLSLSPLIIVIYWLSVVIVAPG